MKRDFDVLVIGAGVIGCAVARELSRYRLKIGVLEKANDLLAGNSARNSAVLHAGFNNKPGSLMARFCVEGNRGFDQLAQELDIRYKRTGKIVVGFTDEDLKKLEAMKAQGEKNGVPGLEIIGKEEIKALAPYVDGNFALLSKSTALLNPFECVIALAQNANKNGVEFFFDSEVTAIHHDGKYAVDTPSGEFTSRWVVNCAGLGAARISTMLGIDEYVIHPCRGEYFILDQKVGPLLPLPAYPVPDPKAGGLGIHLTPSLDGNVFVGPSDEYIDDDSDFSATQKIMDLLISDGAKIFPYLKREYFIRNFAGIRPKLASKAEGGYHDFVIERRESHPYAVNLVGLESPALTGALPIAREVIRLMEEVETLEKNPSFDPTRRAITTFRDKTDEEKAVLIRQNPDYGEIICRCETITKAEVLEAIRSPLGAHTMTGVKYRCRAMMGRCQGGYCQTRISELLMGECELSREELMYSTTNGSYLFTGAVRES